MLEREPWMEYVVSDEDGWCGVREDAPDWAREGYEQYKKIITQTDENGVITKY